LLSIAATKNRELLSSVSKFGIIAVVAPLARAGGAQRQIDIVAAAAVIGAGILDQSGLMNFS
jgi:hypothetical protein